MGVKFLFVSLRLHRQRKTPGVSSFNFGPPSREAKTTVSDVTGTTRCVGQENLGRYSPDSYPPSHVGGRTFRRPNGHLSRDVRSVAWESGRTVR